MKRSCEVNWRHFRISRSGREWYDTLFIPWYTLNNSIIGRKTSTRPFNYSRRYSATQYSATLTFNGPANSRSYQRSRISMTPNSTTRTLKPYLELRINFHIHAKSTVLNKSYVRFPPSFPGNPHIRVRF